MTPKLIVMCPDGLVSLAECFLFCPPVLPGRQLSVYLRRSTLQVHAKFIIAYLAFIMCRFDSNVWCIFVNHHKYPGIARKENETGFREMHRLIRCHLGTSHIAHSRRDHI